METKQERVLNWMRNVLGGDSILYGSGMLYITKYYHFGRFQYNWHLGDVHPSTIQALVKQGLLERVQMGFETGVTGIRLSLKALDPSLCETKQDLDNPALVQFREKYEAWRALDKN